MNETRHLAASMAQAAQALLDSLFAEQLQLAQWDFPDEEERRRWFYTPTDHGGLTLGQMRPSQQQLTMRLLATGLSRAGYVTAATIMGLENVLDELEAWRMSYGQERGRDPGRYYLRIFGTPGAEHLVVALRRSPRLGPPHGSRQRAARVHALFLRRRSSPLALAGAASSSGRWRRAKISRSSCCAR